MQHSGPVVGAFLVAPRAMSTHRVSQKVRVALKPMPMQRLVPSMLIASTNDFTQTEPRSRAFAEAWGSELSRSWRIILVKQRI